MPTPPHSNSVHLLDNPVWYALTNQQARLALGDDRASRYQPDVALFAAVPDDSLEATEQLALLVDPGEYVALFGGQPTFSNDWTLAMEITDIRQMIYDGTPLHMQETGSGHTRLTADDVPAMLELVELTHPGPFFQRTIEMGMYLGIWQDGRLAAMAGERMHLPGYREISAVCTHPDFQRRGYARQLVRRLIAEIQSEGDTPFLHVAADNPGAQALYEMLGFRVRTEIKVHVLRRQSD